MELCSAFAATASALVGTARPTASPDTYRMNISAAVRTTARYSVDHPLCRHWRCASLHAYSTTRSTGLGASAGPAASEYHDASASARHAPAASGAAPITCCRAPARSGSSGATSIKQRGTATKRLSASTTSAAHGK